MLNIVFWPAPVLNVKSEPVTTFDDELGDLVKAMFDTMQQSGGIGLAANQVGITKRLLVVDTMDVGGTLRTEMINPVILDSSEVEKNREGCLSFPSVFINVERHKHITVAYQDMNGINNIKRLDGIDSICVQHELDHINGITFYDRLGNVGKHLHANKFNKLKKRINTYGK